MKVYFSLTEFEERLVHDIQFSLSTRRLLEVSGRDAGKKTFSYHLNLFTYALLPNGCLGEIAVIAVLIVINYRNTFIVSIN